MHFSILLRADYYEHVYYFVFSNDYWISILFTILVIIVTLEFASLIYHNFKKSWKRLFLTTNKLSTQLDQFIREDKPITEDDFITDQYDENYYFLKDVLEKYNKFRKDKGEVLDWIHEIDIAKLNKEREFLMNFNDNIKSLYHKADYTAT